VAILAHDLPIYLSGATADGVARRDASTSLGAYRSANYAHSLAHSPSSPIVGVEILFVAGKCGEGVGVLEAATTGSLTWTAPDDDAGGAVAIANGETKVLPSSSAGKFIIVRRVKAIDLTGECPVILSGLYHNAVAMDPALAGGAAEYRLLVIKNEGVGTATGIKLWVDAASTGLAVGVGVHDANGGYPDLSIGGETVAPPGVSFTSPTSEGTALSFNLSQADHKGMWIRRTPPGSWSVAEIFQKIHLKSPGGEYLEVFGTCFCGDSSKALYELYRGVGASPTFDAPWETFAAPPHTTAALAPSNTYHFVLRRRNAWDYVSQNINEWIITLDADGNELNPAPTAPTDIELVARPGGTVRVYAYYNAAEDGATLAADTWLIYLKIGADPVPGVDEPTEVEMTAQGVLTRLDHETAAYEEDSDVRALVRVRRAADSKDSTNTTIYTTTALAGMAAPTPGSEGAVWYTEENWEKVWEYDASNYAEWDATRELMRFVLGGVVVMGMGRARTLYLKGEFREVPYEANDTQDDWIAYDSGDLLFSVAVNGTKYRVAKLEADGDLIAAGGREIPGYPADEGATFSATPWAWDSDEESLSFTLDGITTAFSVVKTLAGGIYNARIQARRFRENAL